MSKARTIEGKQYKRLIDQIAQRAQHPLLTKATFMLSFYAGLRVQEIAGLRWATNVLDVDGNIRTEPMMDGDKTVHVPMLLIDNVKGAATYGKDRSIAMHPDLVAVLLELRALGHPSEFVIHSRQAKASQDLKRRAHAVKMVVNRFYDKIDFEGCSSHTGRRTFITTRSRQANYEGCSLVDVQAMAGHAHLTTTQRYIDTTENQAKLAVRDLF